MPVDFLACIPSYKNDHTHKQNTKKGIKINETQISLLWIVAVIAALYVQLSAAFYRKPYTRCR